MNWIRIFACYHTTRAWIRCARARQVSIGNALRKSYLWRFNKQRGFGTGAWGCSEFKLARLHLKQMFSTNRYSVWRYEACSARPLCCFAECSASVQQQCEICTEMHPDVRRRDMLHQPAAQMVPAPDLMKTTWGFILVSLVVSLENNEHVP